MSIPVNGGLARLAASIFMVLAGSITALAQERVVFGCPGSSGDVTDDILTIDLAAKSVSESVRMSGIYTCHITDVDGAVGSESTAAQCNIPFAGAMMGQTIMRQRVIVRAPIPITEDERNQFDRLNLKTGLRDSWNGTTTRCHRLPRP